MLSTQCTHTNAAQKPTITLVLLEIFRENAQRGTDGAFLRLLPENIERNSRDINIDEDDGRFEKVRGSIERTWRLWEG